MDAISVQDVHFSYGDHPVLLGMSMSVAQGESVCLTGENGAGKSTLLKLIIGDLKPQSGSVELLGQPMHQRRGVKELGYVPQNNVISKTSFPITSQEIVVQGLIDDFGFVKIPRRRHLDRADEALRSMGLGKYIHYPFSELSGGLQQRVMITRALIHHPQVLILDEPTAGVDKESRYEFLAALDDLARRDDLTVLIVTHDVATVSETMSIDTLVTIAEGRLHAGV